MMAKVRRVFFILAGIAVFLGLLGILMMTGKFSGMSVTIVQNTEEKSYSIEEVLAHNSIQNCWVVESNNVYDITRFVNSYSEWDVFKDKCGGNVDDVFESTQDYTKKILEEYKIGQIK